MGSADPPTILGIGGSLRAGSYTRIALKTALSSAEDAGGETERIDLRELALPVFNPDRDQPPAADRLTEQVRAADAVILATPMYHGSYGSAMKNAIDYCGFEEFESKTVGLLAVSGGGFPITALDHLRAVCRALNAWVLPYEAAVPRSGQQFENGRFRDEELRSRVETLGERLVRYARIEERDPRSFESQENVGASDRSD